VKLNTERFKAIVAETGVTVDDLAAALPGAADGRKAGETAKKKVRNWLAGKHEPVAKAGDVRALANTLGVPMGRIAKWTSQFRWSRGSQQKHGLVVDMIRGKNVEEAVTVLDFSPRRASVMVKKALLAAMADAESADADLGKLVVTEARADGGMIIKRFHPKDRGRAHRIQKKTSHITVSVEEVA
jgi:large subunit ribosomal protein L22